jgi:hypothetical protein
VLKKFINNQHPTRSQVTKDIVFSRIFFLRIEMTKVVRMKTRENIRREITVPSIVFLFEFSGVGESMEDVYELILLVIEGSAVFDFSMERAAESSIDFQVPIANQMAPAIKTIPKIVRMFLVKKDSNFFCFSLFGVSSRRGRLEYLKGLDEVLCRLDECL